MMLAAEAAAYFQRRVRQRLAELHRDLARHRHRLKLLRDFKSMSKL
jgi:hypothetical protein